jgi:hypothetical protein
MFLKNIITASHKTRRVCIIKTSRLMLFKEIITVYSEIHAKYNLKVKWRAFWG